MNYSIQNHTLTFESSYTVLSIKQNGTQINAIALDDPDIIVSVEVQSGNYVINTNGAWGSVVHKYDTDGNQATLSFSGSKLGGIGLVDLRDCGKVGNYEVEYDLECDAVSIRMMSGPKPFRVYPHNTDCYTHDPS
jgi:hypothetical protein